MNFQQKNLLTNLSKKLQVSNYKMSAKNNNESFHPHPGSKNNAAQFFNETNAYNLEKRVRDNVTNPEELNPLKFQNYKIQNPKPQSGITQPNPENAV